MTFLPFWCILSASPRRRETKGCECIRPLKLVAQPTYHIMYKNVASFGPLPNPEKAPHRGMVKALVPFCGLYESIFYDRLATEVALTEDEIDDRIAQGDNDVNHLKGEIVMNMRKAVQTWIDCIEERIERFTGIKVELHFAELVSPAEYNFRGDDLFCWVSVRDVERLMNFINADEDLRDFLDRAIAYVTTPSSGYYPYYTKADFRPLSHDCPSGFYESVFEAVMGDDVVYHLEERWYEKFEFSE